MDNEWKNAKSKLENLFTDSKMRSAIKGQLLGIDIKNRLEYFEGDDEEIKASLNTFLFVQNGPINQQERYMRSAGTGKSRNAEEFYRTAIACLSAVLSWDIMGHLGLIWDIVGTYNEDLELRKKIEDAFVFSVGFKNENSLRCGVE
ncbi:19267_t:CDS:2 [Funneliformis geosporum]|uniref:19267_t:CDS:1 n=1 Tax=Funneliformis geosporum TaxID=1117311 RepID=A0A9W4T2M1_9GLOM|nr:19267_t:CDS:2 [Funneliformis geosporum]